MSMDVAGIVKINKEQYAQTDINGIYPGGPNQPFGGFGLVDPNSGLLYRVTNNSWSQMQYRALQVTIAKNLTHGFQFLGAFHRQWQHLTGTWNPTDPARFIQPDAFPNDRLLWRTDGMQDQNSLATGDTLTNNPMWNPYSVRLSAAWHAPAGFLVSSSYTIMAGPWSGPDHRSASGQQPAARPVRAGDRDLLDRRPPAEPARHAHPLLLSDARRRPGQGAGRPHGQRQGRQDVRADGRRSLELSANMFNLLNGGNYTEYARTGPNRIYNPASYLTYTNPQTPRAFQLEAVVRF